VNLRTFTLYVLYLAILTSCDRRDASQAERRDESQQRKNESWRKVMLEKSKGKKQ
jgi:hypothetical protein